MHRLNNKLIIEIENSSLPVDVNNLITSKENKAAHGIGMQSIRQTVENMNGCIAVLRQWLFLNKNYP